MRLLFAPMVGGRGLGPLTHCMAVADEARRRGHHVHFAARKAFIEIIERFNFAWSAVVEPIKQDVRGQCGDTWTEIAAHLGLTQTDFVGEALCVEAKIFQEFRPDAVFASSNVTIPLTCAERDIPLISPFSWADTSSLTLKTKSIHSNVLPNCLDCHNALLERLGYDRITDLGDLVLKLARFIVIPTIPCLEPMLFEDERLRFVGELLFHALEYDPLDVAVDLALGPGPRLYVYLTTSEIEERVWVETLKAAAQLSGLSILSAAREHILLGERIAIRKWLPGGSAIRTANVCLHPGTRNTMMLAVRHGIPQIMLPLADSERRYHAETIQQQGGGLIVEEDFIRDPQQLHTLALSIAKSPERQAASLHLQAEASRYRGAVQTVDLLESL